MPDFQRTEPVLCGHRIAPHIPLCEHAGRAYAGQLTDADVGRLITTREGTGILIAVHHIDDVITQLALSRGRQTSCVVTTGAGEIVRVGRAPVEHHP